MTKRTDVIKTRFIVNFIAASNIYYIGTKNKRFGDHYFEPFLYRVPCSNCPGDSCKHQFHNVDDTNINMCFYILSIIKLCFHYFKDGRIEWIENAKKGIR